MKKLVANLKSRNITCHVVKDRKAALEKALSLLDKQIRISYGGSATLADLGIIDFLKSEGYQLLDRDSIQNNFMKNFVMKYGAAEGAYIAGANAITEDGMIVNMDGRGNRVNAIGYGPEKVILVAGKNKIVKNLDAAISRIKASAAPLNAKRLKKNTPCVKTGKCMDCRSADRICNVLSVVEFQTNPERMHLIMVEEDLGY